MERRPQRPHYTQTFRGEPVQPKKHLKEPGSIPTPYGNQTPVPGVQSEHIIEGIFISHNTNTTRQLRTRLVRRGVESLSTTELVSLVLRTNAGNESIEPRIHNLLANYSVQELLQIDFGVLKEQYKLGEAKAAQLQAMLEVARRLLIPNDEQTFTIRSPADAAALVRPEMEWLDHEEMRVLLLDSKNLVVGNIKLYQGTANSTVLRGAEIFRPAVARKTPNIILCHNHPSGDPEPSQEDIAVTEQLVQAGILLDVNLVDHIIIGKNNRFLSLKDRLHW